jgi:hypothetical protein
MRAILILNLLIDSSALATLDQTHPIIGVLDQRDLCLFWVGVDNLEAPAAGADARKDLSITSLLMLQFERNGYSWSIEA